MIIELTDGTKKEFPENSTGMDIAISISEGLARNTVGVKVNGELQDVKLPITGDARVELVTLKTEEGLDILRHSSAHIMAAAVKRLFPGVKIAFGPSVENGFYYDFGNVKFSQDDLPVIEDEMKKIIKEKADFQRFEVSRDKALEMFKDEPYKIEAINDLPGEATITCYTMGDFTDLCRGPHIPHTGVLKVFKLLRIAGAYWKGDAERDMLQRLYATSFSDKKELADYLEMRRIAEESDHVKVGKEMDLFITDKTIGQGLPLLTPRGSIIKQTLIRFVEDEERRRGYLNTITPCMAKSDLYKISGHWDHYRDGMFIIGEDSCDEEIALRPMTCPFQFTLYKRKIMSYRDLPVRYAETSSLFRNEASGSMHGLIRIRQFTLSDGHILCLPEQLEDEFRGTLELFNMIMKTLDLTDYTYRFSKWDPKDTQKYIGDPEAWESSQAILKRILDNVGIPYVEAEGEAAFYGPKLDIQMKNVWGKEDTVVTMQIDFANAGRFNLTYQDKDGTEKHPLIIHRSSIGCYERTMALLIEKTKGKFPFWLAPEQIRIMTINDNVDDYAQMLNDKLIASDLRPWIDRREETLKKKVRDAQVIYVPAIVTIGEKEKEQGTVSVRTLDGQVKYGLTVDAFIEQCLDLNKKRALETVFA